MFLVGFLGYIGFVLIGLPSAVPLAVIAGVLELLPNVGPTVAAVPAVIVGFSISPTHGLLALGLTILIQQLENNVFVPKIMQHATGLHPVAHHPRFDDRLSPGWSPSGRPCPAPGPQFAVSYLPPPHSDKRGSG